MKGKLSQCCDFSEPAGYLKISTYRECHVLDKKNGGGKNEKKQ
jgi:hypothetical protein